ncbi:MAG: nicotinate phosphoribosyltransferase, partial [Halalkalicoccus sp.]|nr:nicotinate phosphoribosyltransferase [Halalkalicoccus sp.]
MDDPFETLSPEAIREGTATDAYFLRTETTLEYADKNPHVVAEVTADQFPTGTFEAFGGVKDVANLLVGRDLTVHAIREGRLFDGGPVMRIEGPYLEFARFETSILGFLSQA